LSYVYIILVVIGYFLVVYFLMARLWLCIFFQTRLSWLELWGSE
jgi:hypothetical protein